MKAGRMLKLNNIEVRYSNVILVLKGVSIEVPDGQIIALLGANGAGKTSTLKAISGLLNTELGEVTSGTIEWDGQCIENGDPEKTSKRGIIQVLEGHRVFEHLTVEENIRVVSNTRSDKANAKADWEMVYEYFPRLKDVRRKIAGYASGGEQQMLVIARAMMKRPKLMMLDEPSLGLAPLVVKDIFSVVERFNKEFKSAILLVEQNVRLALSLVSFGYVMEDGRVVLDGPAEKLASNEDVREFYLGLSGLGEKKSYHAVKHYKRRRRWLG